MNVERCRRFLIRLFAVAAGIGLGFLAIRLLFGWMLPFLLAFLTAAALQRPLRFMRQRVRLRRGFLSFWLVLLLVLLIGAAVALLLWQLGAAAVRFLGDSGNLSRLQEGIARVTEAVEEALARWFPSSQNASLAEDLLRRVSDALLSYLSDRFAAAAAGIGDGIISRLPAFVFGFLVWAVSSVLLSVGYRHIARRVYALLPPRWRDLCSAIKRHSQSTAYSLFRAYLLLMGVTFAELTVGFLLLRIPHALPIAALTALVDILPVLGVGTVLIPWAIVLLLTGQTGTALGLLALYGIVTLVRSLLEPRVVSRQIGLSPLATLFFLYVGWKAAGIFGLLLLPLGAMVVKSLYDDGVLPPLPFLHNRQSV